MFFTRLNVDIIINVLKYLPPQDVISFRQTCKSLFQTTLNRTVWLNALRNVIQTHRISKANYPLELMSTSNLEHAALLPSRFIKLLKKSRYNPLAPCSTRLINCRLTTRQRQEFHLVEDGYIKDFCFDPGGRYILVLSRHDSDHGPSDADIFTVFDLGYCGQERVTPVFRLPMPEDILKKHRSTWIGFDPADDGTLFFIITTVMASEECIMRAYKSKVTSTSSTYDFRLCSEFVIPTGGVAYPECFVCPQTARLSVSFTFGEDTHIAVWDFKENKRAIWRAPDCAHPQELVLVSSEDTLFVSRSGPEIRTWIFNIPDLLEPSAFEATPLEASVTISYSSEYRINRVGTGMIETNHGQYIYIQESDRFVFYRLTDIHSQSDGVTIPKKILIKTDSLITHQSINSDGPNTIFSVIPSDREHIVLGYSWPPSDSNIHGMLIFKLDPSGKVIPTGPYSQTLTEGSLSCIKRSVYVEGSGVSVAAGRYFLLTGDDELYVADYLPPPT